MKECALYKKEKKFVKCLACSHYCKISDGKTGICGVRKNIRGKLFSLVYGKIIAEHVDPIEKKPLFHFLPGTFAYSIGTVGCNLKCSFCQNYEISQEREIFGRDETSEEIVKRAKKAGCKSVAYTYNEPTIFAEFVKDTAILAKKSGLKNILVTNGYESRECIEFLKNCIDAANIDLKSFSEKFYLKNCKAKLTPVLEAIKLFHERRIHIEITTLLIPGENDSEKEIEEIAKFISSIDNNIPWHISRFFPMHQMKEKEITSLDKLKLAEKIGKKYLKFVHVGNV